MLWRHGQTAWNLQHRFQGTTNIPLDEVGVSQARRAARLLASLRPDAIIASDLERAAVTAGELAKLVDLPVTFHEELRETYAGVWQGLTLDDIHTRFADEHLAFRRGEPVRRGGGELETEVAARAAPVVRDAVEKLPDGGTLVVASHGGTIRVTLGSLLELDTHTWGALGGLSNCCWSVLGESERGWRLSEHNAGSLPEPVYGDDT